MNNDVYKRQIAPGETIVRKKPPQVPDDKKNKMELFDWLQCIVFAIIIVIFCFIFIGRTIGVDGFSMYGTLHDRDRVVTSNLFYTPSNNDVIIFRSSSPRYEEPLVKRVIAVAGQTIDIDFETGDVFLDGVLLYEPFVHSLTLRRDDFVGPMIVPEGYVFVLGDNRNNSVDSRCGNIGLVDTRYILGRVLFLLIPGNDLNGHRDWSRFGAIA